MYTALVEHKLILYIHNTYTILPKYRDGVHDTCKCVYYARQQLKVHNEQDENCPSK